MKPQGAGPKSLIGASGNHKKDNDELLTQRGLERRIKRHLAKEKCSFFAITVPGFEKILEHEVACLPDVTEVVTVDGGVEFCGPLDTVYFANLQLRTSNRVLLRIDSFTARSYPELYNKAKKIDWELYCGFAKQVSFSVSSGSSRLHHTDNIAQAVFDSLQEKMFSLGVNVENVKSSQIRIHIRFQDDTCTISIDSSGELLYRRGYRTEVAHAPIRETTASALLLAAECVKYPVIADPMCGSGTFLLEACGIVNTIMPGINRQFAFESWPSFMLSKFDRIKENYKKGMSTEQCVKLAGSDISDTAIESALKNSNNCGYHTAIEFTKRDFFEFNVNCQYGKSGLIISNLPYGKRVGEFTELHSLYKKIGIHLKRYCNGWNYGFISADRKFPSISGLKVDKEIRFVNGGIPVTFFYGRV